MPSPAEWTRLQRAVLEKIELDWASGEVHLWLRPPGSPSGQPSPLAQVTVVGLHRLLCPRGRRWSDSGEVCEARAYLAQGGHEKLELELESGDTLELEGERLLLRL